MGQVKQPLADLRSTEASSWCQSRAWHHQLLLVICCPVLKTEGLGKLVSGKVWNCKRCLLCENRMMDNLEEFCATGRTLLKKKLVGVTHRCDPILLETEAEDAQFEVSLSNRMNSGRQSQRQSQRIVILGTY